MTEHKGCWNCHKTSRKTLTLYQLVSSGDSCYNCGAGVVKLGVDKKVKPQDGEKMERNLCFLGKNQHCNPNNFFQCPSCLLHASLAGWSDWHLCKSKFVSTKGSQDQGGGGLVGARMLNIKFTSPAVANCRHSVMEFKLCKYAFNTLRRVEMLQQQSA